ncbi:MAG: tetratricopeptide repeat protein, partial [Bdellovibrionota bacterium]
SVDHDDMNARVKLGLIRMELKDYDGAITSFKAILEKNPESDRIHYYLGSVYEETKRFKEAIGELSQIPKDSKLFSEAALHVAYLYKMLGDTDQASAYLRKQIDSGADVAGFYVLNANIEEEAGRVPEAVAILERGQTKFPKDEKILYYLGSLYDRQGRIDLGLAQMEAIIGINPDNIDALNYLGYTWTTQGIKFAEAEANIRKAMKLKPDNGYIRDSWGWYLFVRGRTGEAVVELEKAVALKPNEPTIIEHLADAYVKSNLWEKALQNYEIAARLVSDKDLKAKIDEKINHLRTVVVRAGPSITPVSNERVPAAAASAPHPISR